ncbi:MAG: efflux RND transporter periplasmic adaptor subunit [Planctomycetia bacterium]|nr:efflux RND transporter periplasmic adaptor subunit [Planctomycetia bacterium]
MNSLHSRLTAEDFDTKRNGMHLPSPAVSLRNRLGPAWLLALAGSAILVALALVVWGLAGTRKPPERGVRDLRVAAVGLVEGASREIAVYPEVGGTLHVLHVRAGQEVQAGDLLFELHNDSQKAQMALAEAEMTSADVQAQQAKADWERSQRLMYSRAVSQETYDANHFKKLTMDAKVAEAKARLTLARAELAKTQVRASGAGQVLQVHQALGTLVEPRKQGDPVLRLADVSRRRVRAWVEELDVARVAIGQPATAVADGYAGQKFAGRVVELAGRMGQDAPRSNRPGEREDVYYREVLIELNGARELPLNLRVDVFIESGS